MMKTIRHKLIALISLVALLAGLTAIGVVTASTASAAGTSTASLSKTTGVVAGEELTVTITNTRVSASEFLGVTICGNVTKAGVQVSGNVSDTSNANNCKGSGNAIGTVLPVKTNGLNAIADDGSGGFKTGSSVVEGAGISAKSYSVKINVATSDLGLNEARCVPTTATITKKCTVAINPATATGQADGSADAYPIHVEFALKQPASIAVASTTGSGTGTSAVRGGGTLVLSGADWATASTDLTVSSCDAAKTNCNTTGLSGTITTAASGGGLLASAKTVNVAAGATTGARMFKFTDGTETAYVPVEVLGTRTISLSTTTVGQGTVVTVTGSGFDAGATVAVTPLAGANPAGTPSITTATATGTISTSVTVTSSTTTLIGASEGTLSAASPPVFTPTANSAAAASVTFSANACTGTNCEVKQIVSVTVNPGVLTISQATNAVTLSTITLDGTEQTSTGNINKVTVKDARGTLDGWAVTATMTDFTKSGNVVSNNTIPAAKLSLTPTCTPVGGALGAEVATGPASTALSNSTGIRICDAASGGGGGTYDMTGALSLKVPASVRAGDYTATLTFLMV